MWLVPGLRHVLPSEDWSEEVPRVLTYVRKRKEPKAYQFRAFTSQRCCMVVNRFTITKVYRQPGYDPGVLAQLEE